MDLSFGGEGPALLQLHKWGPSLSNLNLSEYHEAFISPTRELLLLLSCQCEVLLLPLITGNNKYLERINSGIQSPSSLGLNSSASVKLHGSDSIKDIPFPHEPGEVVSDSNFPHEGFCRRSYNYCRLGDVNSLAWGVCGDTYNQHNEVSFRELLFVSGNYGVTVHAFRQPDNANEMNAAIPVGESARGMWVEWGPSTSSSLKEANDYSNLHSNATENVLDENMANGAGISPQRFCGDAGVDEFSRSSIPKKWLRTFFTEAETVESDGYFWTRFPEKQSVPCSADIVSFGIFESNSALLDSFSLGTDSVNNVTVDSDAPSIRPGIVSDSECCRTKSLCRCTKVFSNDSHCLVGFVLTSVDSISVKASEVCLRNQKKVLLAVAKLHGWGIQWICSVNLDEFGWSDFKFSDNLLACLNASGLLLLYGATSGDYVARIDILQICGLSIGNLGSKHSHDPSAQGGEVKDTSSQRSDHTSVRKSFRRLLVASYTSLLAAIDEDGVIYVICAGNYTPEKYYSSEKLLPHFQQSGLGILVGWEVGGSEIGHQMLYSRFLCSNNRNTSTLMDDGILMKNTLKSRNILDSYLKGNAGWDDFYPRGFTTASQMVEQGFPVSGAHSYLMRTIFLPPDRSTKNDIINFSSFGITWLMRRPNLQGKESVHILHSFLHMNSVMREDGCLSSKCEMFNLLASLGDAIGCSFQGCFYLVTKLGLLVVLPSVSISSNFLPLECIGYRQPSHNTSIMHKVRNNLEIKASQSPCPPWKVEVLDRVLLYEGPEEADRLCFTNGWDLKMPRIRKFQLALHYLKFDEIQQWRDEFSPALKGWHGYLRSGQSFETLTCENFHIRKVRTEEKFLLSSLKRNDKDISFAIDVFDGRSSSRHDLWKVEQGLFDEIMDGHFRSLEMLAGVNLEEEGILRLLFAAVYLMLVRVGSDNEVTTASRWDAYSLLSHSVRHAVLLLALVTCFATKMIRKYGLVLHKKEAFIFENISSSHICPQLPSLPEKQFDEMEFSKRIQTMAQFLEISRNLQSRFNAKLRRPGQAMVDGNEKSTLMDTDLPLDDSRLLMLSEDNVPREIPNQRGLSLNEPGLEFNNSERLALVPTESLDSNSRLDLENFNNVPEEEVVGKKVLSTENPKDMIARWKGDNLDIRTVVKDALLFGRLPLAVLQLHLHRLKDLIDDKEPHDTFSEVRDVGRAIAYDLFLKGDMGLAVATLQRLGEDIEASLKQLVFGTVRRSLRKQLIDMMRRHGYLGPCDWEILKRILFIERLYHSSSFWRTLNSRQKDFMRPSNSLSSEQNNLPLFHSLSPEKFIIECGEIDGVVLGSWTTLDEDTGPPLIDEDGLCSGYWAAAAIWSEAWDQKTVDRVMERCSFLTDERKEVNLFFERVMGLLDVSNGLALIAPLVCLALPHDLIVLDQPSPEDVLVTWESRFEYYICRNDQENVIELLDIIPASLLSDGSLQISLDGLHPTLDIKDHKEFPGYDSICSLEDVDSSGMDVPDIKIFTIPTDGIGSAWLEKLIEQELAKKLVFLKQHWEGTTVIVSLLARSGFITMDESATSSLNSLNDLAANHPHAVQALHKLILHHCTKYSLSNLLDLYLCHHNLVLDNVSLLSFLDAAGDCQWAKWLLLSRVKGHEYEASFANARFIMSRNVIPINNLSLLELDEIVHTVDDIAEGGGEMAALATLVFAPFPIQNCLSSGSIKRHSSSSAQCTLESLRPIFQRFPTLWRTLIAACFGQDATCSYLSPRSKPVFSSSAFSDYLNWREQIFFSSGLDTSLLQMLPCWFPKAVRRLIQLFVQGPLGWPSLADLPAQELMLHGHFSFDIDVSEDAEICTVSWEAAIQKHVEELYNSSPEDAGLGLEHHLHRGRALAAFSHLLGVRIQNLKSEPMYKEQAAAINGQRNVQLDVQRLLAPLTQSEESLLLSVIPLAIVHFEDSMLVASCSFLLELCGVSASKLHVDVAALRRISSFYKSSEYSGQQLSPKGSVFHAASHGGDITDSLARAMVDDHLHQNDASNLNKKYTISSKQPQQALILVLQHLENASLPQMADGKTCGSWLSDGIGNGIELRSKQKAASQIWNLVTAFCKMHQIPLSMKYLGALARDNDWVGFLSEAQIGGYPFDAVIQASKEFSDPRLKVHVSTVLRGLQLRKKPSSASSSDTAAKRDDSSLSDESHFIPVELFGILAECEKQRYPGQALLVKAKELCWSILAMTASCFPDVSPLTCLTVWLEITAARETSSIKVNDVASQIANNVGAAVEATNSSPAGSRVATFHYNRRNPKRRRLLDPLPVDPTSDVFNSTLGGNISVAKGIITEEEAKNETAEEIKVSSDFDDWPNSLTKMVSVLCEQHLFLPLLRAFEIFLPSCSLLPFIRALQAFSQMRLSEASAHLGSFSARIKEEPPFPQTNIGKGGPIGTSWITSTAVRAADAMLSTCPSPYEKRCLLQLLAATDFGDNGSAASHYRRLYWKISLAEPSLRKDDNLHLGTETLDDASLLSALEKNGHWEQARNWARQLEATGGPWKAAAHHVTETQLSLSLSLSQAESMVAEWREFLWDVPEERVALWGHCQSLFIRYSFPPLQAGLFFLKHAEAVEKDLPAKELHELLLLSLQWLSGMINMSNPVYPLHLLREIETRVWLLAVESEAQLKNEREFNFMNSSRDLLNGKSSSMIDRTASIVAKMDNHINTMRSKTTERYDAREISVANLKIQQVMNGGFPIAAGGSTKTKRRAKSYVPSRRSITDTADKSIDIEHGSSPPLNVRNDLPLLDETSTIEVSLSRWEERIGPAELERAVLSLLDFGQIIAAKQLQHKLSPAHIPSEFALVDAALKLAALSDPPTLLPMPILDEELNSVLQSYNLLSDHHTVLESLANIFVDGNGRGLCKRIIAIVKAANVLGISFSEAFEKQPVEVLQLLSLKAQDSFEEANLLVQTHSMPAASIAQILAESFLKGLLAAHRGGYMDSQKEEGPAPLLWRITDFLKWADLCPSEPEIGHALMRLVITGQEIPHACEVELLILSHHFYKSSACLDGVDVLVALAATRVEAYVAEGDFACLARLITGVGNFHALNFILGILIENGQLDLLLQKYTAAAEANPGTAEAVRGFRMAVLTSLKHFNPNDLDAIAMVYNHFDMKHETAALLESRAKQCIHHWYLRYDKEQNEDLLEAMRYFIEAAEVHCSIDGGNKTHAACGQASLVSLQIRMPDFQWLNLSETNARRALVEQSRFQEALVVAEAYCLNQPSEWVLVLWNQMLKPELIEQFVDEFVAVLPLHASTLIDVARFYRNEVAARVDQSHFSVWLTGGGLPAEWAKYLGRSFRCLFRKTRDLRLRLQLATMATGFVDVINACSKALDKVPESAGPLVLRKGHGGAYIPLM
ncbi:Spatacsin, C-terminal domain [Dillenia turbinata]|uniref:Spatacsin, C-terminal domain n=1 Tax=Dillenia turbinata TaxID=194707 RepID=A0AAN8V5Z9_9MAGN